MKLANDIFQVSARYTSPAVILRVSGDAFRSADQKTFLAEMIEDNSFAGRKASQALIR